MYICTNHGKKKLIRMRCVKRIYTPIQCIRRFFVCHKICENGVIMLPFLFVSYVILNDKKNFLNNTRYTFWVFFAFFGELKVFAKKAKKIST